MKWSTTPVSKPRLAVKAMLLAISVVALVGSPFVMNSSVVKADRYDDQIAALQQEINSYQRTAKSLAGKADTLQRALGKLNNEMAQLQGRIDLSEAKYNKLVAQIKKTEQQIEENKDALGETLVDLYIQGDISALEMLASSKNISDFIDKQAYQENLRDSLSERITEIKKLKEELEKDKKSVERVLEDQKNQRKQLAAKQAEQQQLIARTKGQESAYRSLSAKRNSQITDLQRQQAEANARFINGGSYAAGSGPACGGGYPGKWCNIPMDTVSDDWGMFNRECVSYTAFKVATSGRYMPYWGGFGNANQWDDNARASSTDNITVNSSPRAGAIAQTDAGPYGHVMYVESVNSNGTINISQYNADFRGTFSTNTISSGGLNFIHF